jgi:hypothetical protein
VLFSKKTNIKENTLKNNILILSGLVLFNPINTLRATANSKIIFEDSKTIAIKINRSLK